LWEMRILLLTQGYTKVGPLMRLSAAQTGFAFKNSELEKYPAAGVLLPALQRSMETLLEYNLLKLTFRSSTKNPPFSPHYQPLTTDLEPSGLTMPRDEPAE